MYLVTLGNVNDYSDADNVRNCNLVGLSDLYGADAYVQQAVAGYFNYMVDMGVAGFRVDAAKHMWPEVRVGASYLSVTIAVRGQWSRIVR